MFVDLFAASSFMSFKINRQVAWVHLFLCTLLPAGLGGWHGFTQQLGLFVLGMIALETGRLLGGTVGRFRA